MIKINVKTLNDAINYIKISGHAEYADIGYDIVCASVSSICVTTVNALIRYKENALVYTEDEGILEMGIMLHDEVIDMLIENMLYLLQNLSEQYPKNIKINK